MLTEPEIAEYHSGKIGPLAEWPKRRVQIENASPDISFVEAFCRQHSSLRDSRRDASWEKGDGRSCSGLTRG